MLASGTRTAQPGDGVGELKTLLDATDAGADPRVFAACMWSAKEAALKRAGVGLKADLRAHQVVPDGEGGATVSGPTGTVGVRFFDAGGLVLAVTAPQLSCPRTTIRGTPRTLTLYSSEPRTASSITWPAVRTNSASPWRA